jgi:hypothetical protein
LREEKMGGIRDSIERLSPASVSVILTIVILICPMMILSNGWGGDVEGHNYIDIVIVALIWTYFPHSGNSNPLLFGIEGYGLYFLNPSVFINTLTFTFLSVVFAAQVVQFRMGKAQKKQTILLGILSILPAIVWGLLGYGIVFMSGILMYFGPIPIQFLVGLLFMKYSEKWQINRPFEGEQVKNWWEETSQEQTGQD